MKHVEVKIIFEAPDGCTDDEIIEFLYFQVGYAASIKDSNPLIDNSLCDMDVEVPKITIK